MKTKDQLTIMSGIKNRKQDQQLDVLDETVKLVQDKERLDWLSNNLDQTDALLLLVHAGRVGSLRLAIDYLKMNRKR